VAVTDTGNWWRLTYEVQAETEEEAMEKVHTFFDEPNSIQKLVEDLWDGE
jgi:hypothetical protein